MPNGSGLRSSRPVTAMVSVTMGTQVTADQP
jgi:hypothetical protein